MSSKGQEENFAELLNEFESRMPAADQRKTPRVGDTVRGRVASIGRDSVFIELGAKAEAVLDIDQVTGPDGEVTVAVGDTVEARVVDLRGDALVLRTSVGRGPDTRAELAQAHTHKLPVDGVVTGSIKGGVEVQVAGLRAFCPISQLDVRFIENAEEFVGERLKFRIIRYETGRGTPNIVLSRRAILEEEAAVRAAETRTKLHEGAVLSGTVTTIKPYGAFVDLGGIEGMLHISELSFGRVEHPGELLSQGQSVEVKVIKIEKTGDRKRPEKIGLSLKALATDPWDEVEQRFGEGTQVHGKVVRMQPYGVFVELLPGVEGLVHISELGAQRRISHPREVVKLGEEVEVSVLKVDRGQRRISLSMSAAAEAETEADVASYRPSGSGSLGTFADLFKKR